MAETAIAAALEALRAHRAEVWRTASRMNSPPIPTRFAAMHVALDDLLFDYSKQRIDAQRPSLHLQALAKAADVEGKREAMFRGDLSTRPSAAPRCIRRCAISPARR